MADETVKNEPIEAEVVPATKRETAYAAVPHQRTNQIGMMWAFVAVAVFVGAFGGFVVGYVAGHSANDPTQQIGRYRRNTLYQGQHPTGYGSGSSSSPYSGSGQGTSSSDDSSNSGDGGSI